MGGTKETLPEANKCIDVPHSPAAKIGVGGFTFPVALCKNKYQHTFRLYNISEKPQVRMGGRPQKLRILDGIFAKRVAYCIAYMADMCKTSFTLMRFCVGLIRAAMESVVFALTNIFMQLSDNHINFNKLYKVQVTTFWAFIWWHAAEFGSSRVIPRNDEHWADQFSTTGFAKMRWMHDGKKYHQSCA